jgi:hypothetical protein
MSDVRVGRQAEPFGKHLCVGFGPDPVVEALYDEAVEGAEFRLDDMDAAVCSGSDQIDIAVSDRTADRHLAQRRRPQTERLPVRSQPLLQEMLGVGTVLP